jgi:alpha-glucosidase
MNFAKQAALKLRFIKLQRFLGSLFYPLQRDWLERQAHSRQSLEVFEETGNLLQAEQIAGGARFYFQHVELEIQFLNNDLVRVNWQPDHSPIPYGIDRQDWLEVVTTLQKVEGANNAWIVSSDSLKIKVDADGSLEFQDPKGQTLRQELPPQQQAQLSSRLKEAGWRHQAKLRPEEHIYGLGERAAPLNLRTSLDAKGKARTYRMWNYDAGGRYGPGTDPLYLCIPVYLGLHSQGSYLIFYENSYPASFSFKELAIADFEGGPLRYYFMAGSPAHLLERYTELTGRSPLPPRWAFGYHQSRWGYEKESALRETAQGFRTHNLPLCAMHLDIDCLDGFRAFTIDPDRFPNLKEFTQELGDRGIRLITIINPGVKAERHNRLFQQGKAQDVFCKKPNGDPVIAPVWAGMCAFPDFTNPQARHWWSRQYEYLLDLGIAGFWHDMNEPAAFVLWGDASLPALSTQHDMEGRGGTHQEAHNIYGLLQAKAGYESLREYQPEKRPFIVSRSGWAGIQRYAWTWTGDVESSWAGLRQTIPTVLNLGLSGMPYSGPDIGGFKGNPSSELYVRWFQMACLLPFCRTHSANNVKHRTPWSFGEPTLSICRNFLQLRQRLEPYFYTLAWEAHQHGSPLIRPVWWAAPEDAELWSVEDAFLLGDALLVCPIVQQGANSRTVKLPQGEWYEFEQDTLHTGDRSIQLTALLEELPLLVKAGSIIPMQEEHWLVLHLYPSAEKYARGSVYSDAGDGYGEWRIDHFCLKPQPNALELTWQQEGDYALPYKGLRLYVHGLMLSQAWLNGKPAFVDGNCIEIEQAESLNWHLTLQESRESEPVLS